MEDDRPGRRVPPGPWENSVSPSARLVFAFLRLTRANRYWVSAVHARRHVERSRIRPRRFAPPMAMRSDVAIRLDRRGGWPVYTVTPRNEQAEGGVVYAHGGGWVNQIVAPHWYLITQIAAEARVAVTVPIYPLVPFGTAAEVIPQVCELFIDRSAEFGRTAIAGDSAGGQIALSAALALRDAGEVTPVQTVLISPTLDLALTNPEIDAVQPLDPWLGREGTRVFGDLWRGELPIDGPMVSPIHGDLAGIGPISVFSGTRDILNPDARLLNAKAREAGVPVAFHEAHGLMHDYPLTPTREGAAARRVIVKELSAAVRRL